MPPAGLPGSPAPRRAEPEPAPALAGLAARPETRRTRPPGRRAQGAYADDRGAARAAPGSARLASAWSRRCSARGSAGTRRCCCLLYLAPVGVALAVVDWRTRLLPTRLIAAVVRRGPVLAVLPRCSTGTGARWRPPAGAGWSAVRRVLWLLWLVYPRGLGFGDVRLAGAARLGARLARLGPQLLVGVYAGFLLGGARSALLLAVLQVVRPQGATRSGRSCWSARSLGVLRGPIGAGRPGARRTRRGGSRGRLGA